MADLALTVNNAPLNSIFELVAPGGNKYAVKLTNQAVGLAFGSFATASKASSSRLQSIDVETLTSLPTGALAWVQSVCDWYGWQPTSTLVPDGLTVVKPDVTAGAGRFVRLCIPWAGWTKFPTFTAIVIDPINGDDENLGNNAAPLETNAELNRRWGPEAQLAPAAWSITWNSTNIDGETASTNDPAIVDVVLTQNETTSATLVSQPVASQVTTGTITAYAAQNRASGTETMCAVTANISFTGQTNRWATITNGARNGAVFAIAKDLGGNQCRSTNPCTFNPVAGVPSPVTPANGDTFRIDSMSTILFGRFRVQMQANVFGPYFLFQDIIADFGGNAEIISNGTPIYGLRCSIKNAFVESDFFSPALCIFIGATTIYPPSAATSLMAGLNTGLISVVNGSEAVFGLDFLHQGDGTGTKGKLYIGPNALVNGANVAFFDVVNSALTIDPGGVYVSSTQFPDVADLVWGQSNVGVAVLVRADGTLAYNNKPNVNTPQGAGRQSQIGGTVKDWSAVPFMNGYDGVTVGTGNAAKIVVRL